MLNLSEDRLLRLFTTCPASNGVPPDEYLKRVIDVAQWSERCGCTGILVYTDNSLVDPWLVSQVIIQNTRTLSPLVAIQPVYMHPYTVAKIVASIGFLYGRRMFLNMVAGGFKNDLNALNDPTPHDQRYARLIEYTTIILRLLESSEPVSFAGDFYKVDRLKMTPPLSPDLQPGVFVSGSSEAGLSAAEILGATAVKYPKAPTEEEEPSKGTTETGLRVGIVARPDAKEAWQIARSRFPEDRQGQLTHQLAMKVSDSVWHQQLSALPGEVPQTPYWLVPFQNYKTMCPYLVGSSEIVAAELAQYMALGHHTFILDIPPSLEDLEFTTSTFHKALAPVAQ